MKYNFMRDNATEFSIERMSRMLGVSRSGYYHFLRAKPSRRSLLNETLLCKIKKSYENSRGTYGSPRIRADLLASGESCSRKLVAKLMRLAGIAAKMKRKFRATVSRDLKAIQTPNILQQNFATEAPNQRWVADLTYVPTGEGWLYVATVLDLFSRRIVGLAMKAKMTTELVTAALQQALVQRRPPRGLIHHSDRGSQYTSNDFAKIAQKNGIKLSMSGTGNCYDNAVMESFFHTLKSELVYCERYETREQARNRIFEYTLVFYNHQRRHSTLQYLSPAEFEERWCGMEQRLAS